jgi:hypothetical protein
VGWRRITEKTDFETPKFKKTPSCLSKSSPMCIFARLSAYCLIALPTLWASGIISPRHTHGQIAQAINDYAGDRPLQYAANDPWTRSQIFKRHTKHAGFAYNCDGEECKRNSPYITYTTKPLTNLAAGTNWWQRTFQAVAEVKQRIADGSCASDAVCRCSSPSELGNGDCHRCRIKVTQPIRDSHALTLPPAPQHNTLQPNQAHDKTNRPTRSAGLQSLDIRIKNR